MSAAHLDWLNNLEPALAAEFFARSCASRRWVDAMVAHRPFRDTNALRAAAQEQAAALQVADWLEAFAGHPRIGDLGSLKARYAATAGLASQEQSGVKAADEPTLQALAAGNFQYEQRFGYIFIVCASGKTAAEMLEFLQLRLNNRPERELTVAAAEQLKITLLRLDRWLIEPLAASSILAKEGKS